MNQDNITISSLDPTTFEYQTYSDADSQLIIQSQLDTVFTPTTDYIEYYVYDQNQNIIYPSTTLALLSYDVRDGDVLLDPQSNLEDLGFNIGTYNILYTFYRKRLASSISEKYFIANISSDRTEIRLDSNIITNDLIISSSNEFIQYRENAGYFVDFFLNFGENKTVIANNIKLETEQGIDPTILIKLYSPLPSNFNLKDELWVVEELSLPQAYELDFPFEPLIEDDFTYIAGPNYNLNVIQESSKGGELFSFNTLLQSDVTSSINQIQNLLSQKEINININYESYGNFVNFSSAKTRLENFYYKVGLIESTTNQLTGALNNISSGTINTTSYSSSKAQLTGRIDSIIKNFDGYEYFLYFNSGSQYSYPKTNNTPPFILASTSSVQTLEWVGSSTVGDPYYGGQSLSASDYDQNNRDWLYWSIPEYLREDPANLQYELFTDMVGQYYDNVWTYTKDISNKFDADNRLEYGIAKDLVADAIRDFGVKLYSSNFNTNDLFTAFLGLTPSGSAFPFPEMTGSVVDGSGDLAIPSGYEYVDTKISASNDIVPLNDVQKQVYKRVYHNIPYLLKTKGTVAGIRALITSYGIPDTILRISEFGGKDRNESQDYDLKQNVFNYAFDTGASATNFVSSSLQANTKFPVQSGTNKARTIQLRFKSPTLPLPVNNVASSNIRPLQSLWSTDEPSGNLVLEYNGAGLISGSYSGSIASPYDTYGTLKWIPAEGDNPDLSASVYLPFFNGDWWSVQMNVDNSVDASLYAANEIDGKIGFNESSSTVGFDDSFYFDARIGYLNKDTNVVFDDGTTYTPFSGSFQELRYYVNEISQSHFYDYAVNPYSNEGNGINSTPNQQFFRAALGTQLDTGSRTSIHPRVTGSAVQITQSFATDSEFYINSPKFITNVEDIFQDQVPAGIKNRVTNKIQLENLILAEAPYGYQTSTSSQATISSENSDVISPMESIQQQSFVSQSYTPNVNYLEVAFSPSNQINDDINAQLGYFNLGDYIGDPRFISSSLDSYPALDRLRDAYFEKYINGYDVVDFIRLIKFFDNSLFKMIKDFTPARTSLASGVVVKQHLLERNRQRPAQVTSSLHDYEGLVVNLPKNYSSGSSDFPQYSTEGSSIYRFSGGTGGSFERFNGLNTSPSASIFGLKNRFFLSQSWSQSVSSSVINSLYFNQSSSQYISASGGEGKYPGPSLLIKSNQSEFYDGIFSGSYIQVEDGILNPDCGPYLSVADTNIRFNPIFYGFDNALQGSTVVPDFLLNKNTPLTGDAWIGSTIFPELENQNESRVILIKLANSDLDGNIVGDYIFPGTKIEIIFPDTNLPNGRVASEYFVAGVQNNATNVVLTIDPTSGDANVTGSISGGSEDWTVVDARGSYRTQEILNNDSQGEFKNNQLNFESQNIFFWGNEDGTSIPSNPSTDTSNQFNTGSTSITTTAILNGNGSNFDKGAFNIERTPNIPLFFSCSIAYSSSLLPDPGNYFTQSGVYHSSSNNTGHVQSQSFDLVPLSLLTADTGSYIPAPFLTEGLSPVYFTDYNALIPGNSASWWDDVSSAKPDTVNLAGHPQFIFPGTSSLDFHFPSITFQQIASPSVPPTYELTSFTSAGLNDDFKFQATSLYSPSSITSRMSSDGTIGINFHFISQLSQNTWNNGPGIANPADMFYLSGQAYYMYDLECDPGTDISASAYGIRARSTAAGGTLGINPTTGQLSSKLGNPNTPFNNVSTDEFTMIPTSTPYSSPTSPVKASRFIVEDTINPGKWRYTGSFINGFARPTNDLAVPDAASANFFKPVVLGSGAVNGGVGSSNVEYKITNMRLVFRWVISYPSGNPQTLTFATETNSGLNLTQYPTSNLLVNNPLMDAFQGTGTISSPTPTFNQVNLQSAGGNGPGQVGVRAELRRRSGSYNSTGNIPDTLITSSALNVIAFPNGTSTFQTITKNFIDSPILGIKNDVDQNDIQNPGGLGSTRNDIGDIYYIKYRFSLYKPNGTPTGRGSIPPSIRFIGAGDPINSGEKLIISQSVLNTVTPLAFTGSIEVLQGKTSTFPFIGNPIISETYLETTTQGTGRASITGSINLGVSSYNIDDAFRMVLNANKNPRFGMSITEYSMSIFNSSSRWSRFNDVSKMSNGSLNLEAGNYRQPNPTSFIVDTFYGNGVLPFQYAVDCQPLLNNYNEQRPNPYLEDVDYNYQTSTLFYSSSLLPVNIRQIISGSAVRATVPVSNYTSLRSILPRYNGSKSTSQQLNVWNIGDTGTYGKNPTVELRDAYFGYFNDLDDPYPNINGLTRVNLNYLIDEQGNALPPSLSELSISTFQAVFPNSTLGKIAAKNGKGKFRTLGVPSIIERSMEYVTPIMYTQNSGNNYSKIIPLSGSGYISQYDNGDENDVSFARFTAMGPASVDTSSPVQTVDYYLDPTADIKTFTQNDFNPYTSVAPVAKYLANTTVTPQIVSNVDLPSSQIVSVQNSFVTTFVSETKSVRRELQFEFHMYSDGTGTPGTNTWQGTDEQGFNLEDIECKVYTTDGRVANIGSVLDYGWFGIENIVRYETVRRKGTLAGFLKSFRFNRWIYSKVPVPTGGIKCIADWEMYETLFDLGLWRSSLYEIQAIEWIITANSGKYTIKGDDIISWRVKGLFRNAKSGYRQGMFFPLGYEGAYTSVNIKGQGANDYLMGEANTAAAPFWEYGDVGNDSEFTSFDPSILVMASSNINEAYGTDFRQGDLEYVPGRSDYFPGGVEPSTTSFDAIESTLLLQEGDEIRFANNENYTFKIINVFAPQENIVGSKARLKIKLGGQVDKSINKDFFLVRRPVVNPNSLYLDLPFPYATLASSSISTIMQPTGSFALTSSFFTPGTGSDGMFTGSLSSLEIATTPGILYPDFPTEYLIQSASSIVNDLISKGIIES